MTVPSTETPTQQPAATPQEGAQQPAAPEKPAATEKPWGDDSKFDAEKAWNLIEGLRADKEKLSAREVLTPQQKADLAELERLKEASKTELERAQEAASKSQERISAITARAVAAEVKALAADQFADPSDAAAFLDLSKYADDEGDINTAAIAADLADLVEKKPHLAKVTTPPDPRAPRPTPGQGGSGSGAPDVNALIAEAQAKGDFKTVIHLQNQKLASQSGA